MTAGLILGAAVGAGMVIATVLICIGLDVLGLEIVKKVPATPPDTPSKPLTFNEYMEMSPIITRDCSCERCQIAIASN